ncbi:DnaJ subfamily B member 13 [Blattella germanica]|nr:DnaJ subfamily B member 13 [Blattella germanica]
MFMKFSALYRFFQQIFHGGIKRLKIQRYVLTGCDETTTELKEKILSIHIKPGLPEGTELKFEEFGDQGPTIIPG